MSLFKKLKRNSRLALKGNWPRAIAVLIIFFAVILLLSVVQQYVLGLLGSAAGPPVRPSVAAIGDSLAEIAVLSVFTLLTILLTLPLEMGVCRWFYLLVSGRASTVPEAFVFFESLKKYGKSIWLYINILSKALLWAVLYFVLPSGIMWFSTSLVNGYLTISGDARFNAAVGTVGFILAVVLYILASVLYIICMNRYALAVYILSDEMDNGFSAGMNTRGIIKLSVKYSKGYRTDLFLFQLSFAGWFLLCVLIIPIFFVLPYYYSSVSMFARYIIEKNRSVEAREEAWPGAPEGSDTAGNGDTDSGGPEEVYDDDIVVEEPTTRISLDNE